jgi:signal transduction histidine kinase
VHRLKENRERLGRDLHDHIIQSIYAMGLNIEECRQLLDEPGKADSRLRSALGEVNGVIRELRNVIQGLETNAIQPAEFRTALKSLALMLGNEQSSRVRLDLSQEAIDRLTQQQATELVHIAREAVSNSVRHGKAATTTFTLAMHPGKLRFCVEDDGCGFDPQLADSKGYGLRNMAKRAEGLGAEFTIHSQEGTGTRIVLDIPNQKQHLSHSESHSRINR